MTKSLISSCFACLYIRLLASNTQSVWSVVFSDLRIQRTEVESRVVGLRRVGLSLEGTKDHSGNGPPRATTGAYGKLSPSVNRRGKSPISSCPALRKDDLESRYGIREDRSRPPRTKRRYIRHRSPHLQPRPSHRFVDKREPSRNQQSLESRFCQWQPTEHQIIGFIVPLS